MQPAIPVVTSVQSEAFIVQLGLTNPKIDDFNLIKLFNCTTHKVEVAAGKCIKVDDRTIQKPNGGFDPGASYGLEAYPTFDWDVLIYEATCLAVQARGDKLKISWRNANNSQAMLHTAEFTFAQKFNCWLHA